MLSLKGSSQSKKILKAVFLISLALFILWFIIHSYYNVTGFCHQKQRYLSKQEIIDSVIKKNFIIEDDILRQKELDKICLVFDMTDKDLHKKFPIRKCGNVAYRSLAELYHQNPYGGKKECYSALPKSKCGTLFYQSVKEFHNKNPDCCHVDDEPWYHGFFYNTIHKIFGFYQYGVSIYYMKNPYQSAPYYDAYYTIDSCGNNPVWNHGMSYTHQDHLNLSRSVVFEDGARN